MRVSSILLAVTGALAVTALYHLFVVAPDQRAADAALHKTVADLRAEFERKPPQGAVALRRLLDLELRLAALEGQGGGGDSPSWTARDLEQLRTMLEALREADRLKRSAVQLRTRLTTGKVALSDEQFARLTPLLLRYTDSLLDARELARQGVPPSERFRGAREAHARMCADVRALLAKPEAEKVIGLFPAPTAPRQPAPLKKIGKDG